MTADQEVGPPKACSSDSDEPAPVSRTQLNDRELVIEMAPVVFAYLDVSGFRDDPTDAGEDVQGFDAVALHLQRNFGLAEAESQSLAEKCVVWTIHIARNSAMESRRIGAIPHGNILDESALGMEFGLRFLQRVVILEANYSHLFVQARPPRSRRQPVEVPAPIAHRARTEALPDGHPRPQPTHVQQHFSHYEQTHYHINNNQPPSSMVVVVVVCLIAVIGFLVLLFFGVLD